MLSGNKKIKFFKWLKDATRNLSPEEKYAAQIYFICGLNLIDRLIEKRRGENKALVDLLRAGEIIPGEDNNKI